MADTVIPGRRQPIDFENSGLTAGTPGRDDQKKGLALGNGGTGLPPSAFGYPEPNGIPVIVSPGNQRKVDLGSERN